ncbi:TRAP transporter small permease [Geobacillus jurassicus]|uniref:TRAP transporter small permease n=1 Tax=Geobacillus jurassicus TaxID=235932 RepID=A0ABV6GN47_9BACL|nr:TRAP transporter small permease [Geobacillus jurassicus]
MKWVHRLSNGIYVIEKVLAVILCVIMLVSLSLGVVYRYVLSSPLTWAEEVSIFSLVWLTFIGGSMSLKRKEYAAITIVMDKLQGKAKIWLLGLSFFIVFVFVLYIFYLAFKWISSPTIMLQYSNAMRLPMIIPYLSVPVSFLFMIVHSLDLLLNHGLQRKGEV